MTTESSGFESQFVTVFERVGGYKFFEELVEKFYQFVEVDPILRPLYPKDLQPGKANLAAFLAQYWGGPANYSLQRGQPRLRQRHMAFPIGQIQRDAWVANMVLAVQSMKVSESEAALMTDYFENAATLLMNC